MLLPLKYYGDPVLRKNGARVEEVTDETQQLIADMLETMAEYKGLGLASQQVGEALQLMVLDIRAADDRPSTLKLDGRDVYLTIDIERILIPYLKIKNKLLEILEGMLKW